MNTFFITAIGALAIGAAPGIAGVVKLILATVNEDSEAMVDAQRLVRVSTLTFPIGVAAAIVCVLCEIFF